jgi:carboxymethylenebutenolidase
MAKESKSHDPMLCHLDALIDAIGEPGQHHAFARHNGAHYNAAAAALANGRTSEFLHYQLR